MRTVRRPTSFLLGAIALLLTVGGVTCYYILRSPGTADFRLHRARYEEIVARVKMMGLAPEEYAHFWTDANLEPNSLARKRAHRDMVGMISAWRTATGQYQISITTRDEGHLGTFGYVYSETMLPPSTGDLPSIERQIGPHWWIAYNDEW